MSHRVDQVRSTLRRAVQQVLAEGLSDPRAQGTLITVTETTVSADLRNATIMVSVLPEKKQDLVLHALTHAAGHIRRQAGELMALSRLPQLSFRIDTSLKKQAEVMAAINRAAASAHPDSPHPDGPGNTSTPGSARSQDPERAE